MKNTQSLRIALPALSMAFALMIGAMIPNAAEAGALSDALAKGKKQGSPVLILCTSDGCAPCEVLKQRLKLDPSIKKLVDKCVQLTVHLDQEDEANPFVEKFNPDELVTPMLYIVDTQGKAVESVVGYPDGDELVEMLKSGIAKSEESAESKDESEAK